ncbi:MAG TPA: LamG-like jellyroll fold domain-containing protein, partial [Anaerolineae bacterium]
YFWAVTAIDRLGNESGFSNIADTIIVVNGSDAPTIITQPQNATTTAGETVSFSIVATGSLPLSYQWQKNGADIIGVTGTSYTTPPVSSLDDGATFRCVVTNSYGRATSQEARLTVISETGGRVADGQIVLYTFEEGSGTEVYDVSGIGTPLNLQVSNSAATAWIPGALVVNSSTLIASIGAATKIVSACKASSEITIEAWIKPNNTSQNGPARIISLSTDPYVRNVTMGQGISSAEPPALYDIRLRTTATSDNGVPSLNTPDGSLTTQLSHVVYTRNTLGVAKIYIDNVQHASATIGGDFSNWSEDFPLVLANELTGDRPWLGELHLVAIFDRELSPGEVSQNYSVGPGYSDLPTSVAEEVISPDEFQLFQNYPNPFNPATAISYRLPRPSHVALTIFDINGRKVHILVDTFQAAGEYTYTWNGVDLQGQPAASGMYFYRINALNMSLFRKMTLVK